jgi:hypothetical protein
MILPVSARTDPSLAGEARDQALTKHLVGWVALRRSICAGSLSTAGLNAPPPIPIPQQNTHSTQLI